MIDRITAGIQLVMLLCQGFLLQSFLGSFLEYKLLRNKWNVFLITVMYGTLAFGMDYILPTEYGMIRIIGKKMFAVVVVWSVVFCFYKARRSIMIFLIVTFLAVSDICFFIAYMIMQMGRYLTDFWVELFDKGYFASEDAFMNTVEISLTIILLLMYAVFFLLSYIFLRKISKSFREREYFMQKRELLFLLAPSLAGLFLCLLLRLIMITVEDGVPELLYDKHPSLMVLVPIIMLLALMSILYSVKLFQDMVALHKERSSRIILEKQIVGMQEHVKEVERLHEGVRSMKHDMKNTLAVIMQLAENGAENENLRVYLEEINHSFQWLEPRFHTGNGVADILLNMKYHEAIEHMPDLQICAENLLLPEKLHIRSFDLGVILGNALDNAIEACRKCKEEDLTKEIFVRISSFTKGRMFFIEVENSFTGKLLRCNNSEFPVTNKGDRNSHGMGFLNMKNTAEKYHGGVDFSVNGKVFTLTVMMQNEEVKNVKYW